MALHRMGLVVDVRCVRCSAPDATFTDLAWTCLRIANYWQEVCEMISAITSDTISPVPTGICQGGPGCQLQTGRNAAGVGQT